jgi:MFS transporter, SET family, sugar efflux transporter
MAFEGATVSQSIAPGSAGPGAATSIAEIRPSAPAHTRVIRNPLYRGATIAMFLSGLGVSAAAPQIALFLVKELGASLPTAGLFYLTNLTAPVAGYLVGARSDRTGRRLGLFRWCAMAGFAGWLGIAASTQVWMPFVMSAVVLAFAGAATSQLFAAVHDEVHADSLPGGDGIVAVIRTALTAGWVVGPALGSWIAATLGLRTMLVATGVCMAAQVLPIGTLHSRHPVAGDTAEDNARHRAHRVRPRVRAMLPLVAFTGLYVLVYAGEPVKYGFLPLYMHDQLRLPPGTTARSSAFSRSWSCSSCRSV